MQRFKKVMLGAAASLAAAAGVVGATAGSAAADSQYKLCTGYNLSQDCIAHYGNPQRVSYVGYVWNDTISSIQTNEWALETWNDSEFRGTYGYFEPWHTWNYLSSPYNNAISSYSTPGL